MGFMPRTTRSATLVVAASDSRDMAGADYVCDGTDDQVEINQAIAALGMGAVILLEGTFNITGPLNLASNVALVGQGAGTVLRIPDGHNADLNVIYASSADHLLVTNLRIDGNQANQTTGAMHGIYFDTVTYSKVESCWVEDIRRGIRLVSSSNNTITGNNIQSNRYDGIRLENTCDNNTITGNNIQSSIYGHGILLLTNCGNNTITGNNIQSNALDGIRLENTCDNNTITGNNIQSNGGYGILIYDDSDNNITGNNIQSGNLDGIVLWNSNNNTVTGNTVVGNSQLFDNTYDGILIRNNSDYNNIQGNTVRHAGGANQHRYGIRINSADCNGNLVINNDLYNAGRTADYSDAGTGTIYHNNRTTVGWVP